MFSVIFDMDGTLLDTQQITIPAWDYAGELQGVKNVGSHIPNVCGMNQAGWSAYLKNTFPTLNIEAFCLEMREYIIKNLKVKYKKGAKELLDFLKENNIKIGLASGSSGKTIEHHLKEVNALELFDAAVGGLEVENGKPAPDIFLLTAEKMGVKPEDCFIFEDAANGIAAGYKAGMKCIGVPDITAFDAETKKLMFAELEDLSQAIPIFEKLL